MEKCFDLSEELAGGLPYVTYGSETAGGGATRLLTVTLAILPRSIDPLQRRRGALGRCTGTGDRCSSLPRLSSFMDLISVD